MEELNKKFDVSEKFPPLSPLYNDFEKSVFFSNILTFQKKLSNFFKVVVEGEELLAYIFGIYIKFGYI